MPGKRKYMHNFKSLSDLYSFIDSLGIKSFPDLYDRIKKSKILLERDSLGAILEATRLREYKSVKEVDEIINKNKWESVMKDYGFNLDSDVCVLTGDPNREFNQDFLTLVNRWYTKQGTEKVWNPFYCQRSALFKGITSPIIEFCSNKSLINILDEFNISIYKQQGVFPFNSWDITRVMEYSYKR